MVLGKMNNNNVAGNNLVGNNLAGNNLAGNVIVNEEDDEIDLLELFEVLWNKAVLIIFVAIAFGAIALGGTFLLLTPKYQSSAMMFVNNSSFDMGSTKINLSDLNASKSLAETYSVILKSRTTLQMIIDKMGLDYNYKTLNSMISTTTVNETEVFRVTVTSTDPEEAAAIANCIVDVLPNRINSIMEGSNVKIVDTAVVDNRVVSPNYKKNAVIGAFIGFVLTAGIVILLHMFDTTIHSEDILFKEYSDIPLLTIVPIVGINEEN